MADEADDLRTSLLGECIGEDNIISRMGEDALTRGGGGIGEDAVNVNELIVYLDCIVRRSLHSEYCDANQRFLMVLVSISGSCNATPYIQPTLIRHVFVFSLCAGRKVDREARKNFPTIIFTDAHTIAICHFVRPIFFQPYLYVTLR